ncbi:unnamed protein product [marine sediment metagenome]|uniref:Uncharacterized protein n=1 Tax=marine sediment metagenome TaxID=412755 RepID=X1GF56_9ZZZZ
MSSTVSVSQYANEGNEIRMIFTGSMLDAARFVSVPTDVEFRSITVEDHMFIETVEKKPETVFYTTDDVSPDLSKPEMVYGESYRQLL